MRHVLPVAVLFAALSGPASALEVATWNIGWLTSRAAEINKGIADENRRIYQRMEADFALLRAYVEELDADVIALQEIDSIEAAQKVFPPQEYSIILTDEPDYQRPGFAIRKGLRHTRNPDLEELDLLPDRERSLRRGADITVHLPGGDLRLLAVHLKSGCFSPASSNKACGQIEAQIPIVARWIDARQKEGLAFAVMGDFNRRFPEGDPLWTVLDNGPAPLVRVTAGRISTCWGGQYPEYIDHIILGGAARDAIRQSSFETIVFQETGKQDKTRLSDHCPVSIHLRTGQ